MLSGTFGVVKYQDKAFTGDIEVSEANRQIRLPLPWRMRLRLGTDSRKAQRPALQRGRLYLEDEIRTEMNFAQIIGNSASLRKVLKHVETVAPTDSTVLIYGETGTGKELIARAIHDLSPRRSKSPS